MQFFSKGGQSGWLGAVAGFCLVLAGGALTGNAWAAPEQTSFGLNLSGGKEAVQIEANGMEMRDKEGIAVFTGNVSVIQGDRMLRAGKMVIHYIKPDGQRQQPAKAGARDGLGATGVEKMEVSDKVYIKSGTQVAVGDQGVFDSKSNIMVLTGAKVVLTDGDNVATGCKLTAHMSTGKAFMESCSLPQKKGRVSIIINRD